MSQDLDLYIPFKKCKNPEASQFCLFYDPDGLCLLDTPICGVIIENARVLVGKVSRLGRRAKA